MAILRIRDRTTGKMQEVLCLKGEKGDTYTLTDADKAEIAATAKASQQAAEEAKNEAVEAAREAITRAHNAAAAATSAERARDAAVAAQVSAEEALAATQEQVSPLENVLRDILTAIQSGGTTSNTVSEIEQILVSYFENKTAGEIES